MKPVIYAFEQIQDTKGTFSGRGVGVGESLRE